MRFAGRPRDGVAVDERAICACVQVPRAAFTQFVSPAAH
jgi:hypothetical protein